MLKKILFLIVAVVTFGVAGCYNDALDPTQLGRFEPTPSVNVILDTLGVADEPSPVYEGAEDPRPQDLIEYERDYVFGPGDVIRISVFELYQEGVSFVNDYVVTETGRVSIPDVGLVRAEGLTEAQLEQEIADILSPSLIKNPSVTATLVQSQKRYFSIVGQGVAQSARYPMPRYTIRLTEAIAYAGGIGDFNVSYIYVSRDIEPQDVTEGVQELTPVEPGTPPVNVESEMLEMITPSEQRRRSGMYIASAEMASQRELEALAAPEGIDAQDLPDEPDNLETLLPAQKQTRVEWVFEDGQWKPVQVEIDAPEQADQPRLPQPQQPLIEQVPATRPQAMPETFGLDDLGTADEMTRVIKIPVDRLLAGDPRYNIVIRPGDRITVPRDLVGEFWVGGNVNAPNAYPITGRPITLKQVIPTAGGLNTIAWPKKVEVIRRIGRNKAGLMQEEIVLVDLEKISKGLQPDFFIKPYDLINVGTHGTSRWLAVLRNAFRATYGFGFIYDRNFADRDFGGSPLPF